MKILNEIRTLRDEGKLHRRLIIRTRILFGIATVFFSIALFNVLSGAVDWRIVAALFAVGVTLGLFVFSRINVVLWNEEEERVEAGKMDMLGFVALALYIGFEISLRTFLTSTFPEHSIAYLLAGISGTLLGRSGGALIAMHREYYSVHPIA